MGANNTYCLYRHISPSGKVYVGITSLSPNIRWGANGVKYCQHSNYPIARAITKYGWDAFRHEVIFDAISEEKAKRFEQHLISFYKMLGVSYNITNGGESGTGNKSHTGRKMSDESRKKMSLSAGHVVYQYSKNGEFIRKWNSQKEAADALGIGRGAISSASCGRVPSYKGYYWSPLPPDKWQRPARRHTDSGRKRKVYQFDKNGILIKEWDSVTSVHNECGFSLAQIAIACCYDGRAHGYLWAYTQNIETKKIEAQKQIAKTRTTKTNNK